MVGFVVIFFFFNQLKTESLPPECKPDLWGVYVSCLTKDITGTHRVQILNSVRETRRIPQSC